MEAAKKETWSFSKEINGVKKSVRGEQVENGWIVTINKEWKEEIKRKDSDELMIDWKYETKQYISKENPIDSIDELEGDNSKKEVKNMLSSLVGSVGKISVK